jgi:hypothetical protein
VAFVVRARVAADAGQFDELARLLTEFSNENSWVHMARDVDSLGAF